MARQIGDTVPRSLFKSTQRSKATVRSHCDPLIITCRAWCGAGRDWEKRERGTLDDTLGGYSLTLIDSLDMLAVLGDYDR